MAVWVPDFFGYDDGTTTEIPLGGGGTIDAQNRFRLAITDLSRDRLANSPNHSGEIRIFVRDQKSGQIIDQWRSVPQDAGVPVQKFGGIPVGLLHRTDGGAFSFCAVRSVSAHDEFGFAIRREAESDCSR